LAASLFKPWCSKRLCALTHCRPHRYHFIRTATTWLKAQMYCRELHTDLATVYDIEDMNRVVNTAQDATGGFKDRAWIGLYENLTNWRWSRSDQRRGPFSDEEGDDFRGWDVSQPDNFLGDEMCVNMGSAGGWEDSPCFLQNPFICYNGLRCGFILMNRFIMSWSDAQLYCRDRYTDLASVRNEEENRKIQRLTKESSTWIGLFRSGKTREWSDQSDSTYLPQQYRFINISLSWHEAQRFCRVKFADLATVNNMDDKNKLVNALRGRVTSTWIGLHTGASYRWMWADGSGRVGFTKWNDGEPNHASADEWCAETSSTGTWNDASCAEEKNFVCYERE
uniref:C-type lectin domain-containing protein n=1 Tax=Stegastes partitus TaxID=144197 RepID=A0A3B5A657_9TELE